jgi:hypothetical protein
MANLARARRADRIAICDCMFLFVMRCFQSILRSAETNIVHQFSVEYNEKDCTWEMDDKTLDILHATYVSRRTIAVFEALEVICKWSHEKKQLEFTLYMIFLQKENGLVPRGSGMLHAVLQGLKMGILTCNASEDVRSKTWNIALRILHPVNQTTMAYVRKEESFPKSMNSKIEFGLVKWNLCKTTNFAGGGWFWKVACTIDDTNEQKKAEAQREIQAYNKELLTAMSPAELIPRNKITFCAESLVAEHIAIWVKNSAVLFMAEGLREMLSGELKEMRELDLCQGHENPLFQAIFDSLACIFEPVSRKFVTDTGSEMTQSKVCSTFELRMSYRPAFEYLDLVLLVSYHMLQACRQSVTIFNDILFKSMTVTQSSAPGNNPRSITHTFLANADDDYDTQTPTNELGCLMCSRRYVDLRI